MNGNGFEVIEEIRDYFTYYFIETHLKSLNNEIEIIVDSSHKCLKPIRKVLEKEIKDDKNQVFMASVYGIDFKPSALKKKEIKEINGFQSFPLKIILKMNKNKFESHIFINVNNDNFSQNIKFDIMKKIFKKDIDPPVQLQLTNLQTMEIFNEAILIKERRKKEGQTYKQLLKFGINLLKNMISYELILFLMLYTDILNGDTLSLIKEIFDIFSLKKIIKPTNKNSLSVYLEKMDLLYNEQNKIFEKIQRIPMNNFNSYLIKYYTIHIYLYSIMEKYEDCETIMKDLRDNNPYDNLILAKLYLSEYSQFYRSIPISDDMQNSLMGKFINTSQNYNELLTSFSIISDYIKKDFVNTLLIITENYDKINEICLQNKSSLKINDYITQKENDDLIKVQNYLDIIAQKKVEKNFMAISFNIVMWDYYLADNKNENFLEFLKSNLIKGSLNYNDIIASLVYIIKYTKKDFIQMLKIVVNNYDKLKSICISERKNININDYIQPNENDNQEKIKEYLTYIVSQKIKDKSEIICFNINIWKYYITNKCPEEFLSFLEEKLYESAINSKDIFDCADFSSNFRKKAFIPMLEIIFDNFDNIQKIFKTEAKCINIDNYIQPQPETDDLSKILELIKNIIDEEKKVSYCTIRFNIDLWLPYSQCENLEKLKLIRKIIIQCQVMQPDLNEDVIQLGKKIHDIGFNDIQKGVLVGEQLLQFLAEDEAYYVNKQINDCIQKNINLQNQINNQAIEIEGLKRENNNLTVRLNTLEGRVVGLCNDNSVINGRLFNLENEKNRLEFRINENKSNYQKLENKMKKDYEHLEKKIDNIKKNS